ncbi:MAG: hypothetical protein JWQ40_2620 [Segetibacter sp.]|nr:hypothetical protein [Segetibacter sp.]
MSKYIVVFRKLVQGSYKLCVSTDIPFEYLEIFNRKFKQGKAETVFLFLREATNIIETEVYYFWKLVAVDPDDNKFVDCAIAADADY